MGKFVVRKQKCATEGCNRHVFCDGRYKTCRHCRKKAACYACGRTLSADRKTLCKRCEQGTRNSLYHAYEGLRCPPELIEERILIYSFRAGMELPLFPERGRS